jgi:hypothetical protein
MTPQEKAQELIEKYKPYVYCYFTSGMQSITFDAHVQYAYAKAAALIAVDEVLKETSNKNSKIGRLGLSDTEYWEQVKKELI